MNLIEKYLGEKKGMKADHAGQYESKRQAQQNARTLTRTTGIKHNVVKTKAYREGGMKEIEVWTVVADVSNKKKF